VFLALQIVRQYPTQIEADLEREYSRDILDWYRGKLSSRKLLVLLGELSDDSALKTELGATGWPDWVQMIAQIHEFVAMDFGARYKPKEEVKTFLPPKDRVKHLIEAEERKQFKEEVESDLFEGLGWS